MCRINYTQYLLDKNITILQSWKVLHINQPKIYLCYGITHATSIAPITVKYLMVRESLCMLEMYISCAQYITINLHSSHDPTNT